MSDSDLEALRSGKSLSDPRLEALRVFARTVTEERGNVPKQVTDDFISAGFTKAQVFEVMLGIAYKTMSNYVNHIVGTGLDEQLKKMQWQPPSGP
jgi:alkylhydroperoxidase family enzyme